MGSPSDTTHVVPTHQRITSSKQWVLDHRRESNGRQATNGAKSTQTGASTIDKETKKRLKELETAKLQVEYDSVKQENDKLKKVIARLKQEIQVYNGLLASEQPQRQQPLKDLLINKSKRRKKNLDPSIESSLERSLGDFNAEPSVTNDDILLMNTLTDVLAQMEQP